MINNSVRNEMNDIHISGIDLSNGVYLGQLRFNFTGNTCYESIEWWFL